MGRSKKYSDLYFIPDVYYKAGNWLDEHRKKEGPFRTLWVPLDPVNLGTEKGLRWIDTHKFNPPQWAGLYHLPNLNYVESVLNSLCGNHTDRIGALLVHGNVKYIVVNLRSLQKGPVSLVGMHNSFYPTGDPKGFLEILNQQRDLKLAFSDSDFVVYENKEFILQHRIGENEINVTSTKQQKKRNH
ncbi:unnamed protein product, partial [marine sediment metagenome]